MAATMTPADIDRLSQHCQASTDRELIEDFMTAVSLAQNQTSGPVGACVDMVKVIVAEIILRWQHLYDAIAVEEEHGRILPPLGRRRWRRSASEHEKAATGRATTSATGSAAAVGLSATQARFRRSERPGCVVISSLG